MIEYRFEPEEQRSAAYVDGGLIGVCQYSVSGNSWLIVHTEVLPAFGGRGIARKLVEIVAEEAENQGVEIIPVCSYTKKVLD